MITIWRRISFKINMQRRNVFLAPPGKGSVWLPAIEAEE